METDTIVNKFTPKPHRNVLIVGPRGTGKSNICRLWDRETIPEDHRYTGKRFDDGWTAMFERADDVPKELRTPDFLVALRDYKYLKRFTGAEWNLAELFDTLSADRSGFRCEVFECGSDGHFTWSPEKFE